MIRQLRLEAFKLTHRGRSYIGPAALLGMAGLMVIGLKMGPPPFGASVPGMFTSAGSYVNGGFLAWFQLRLAMTFFLPLFACVVTGDLISGEANDGTLRTMLSRPVRRGRLYLSKFLVALAYSVALTYFLGLAAYALGSAFLGHGSLLTFQEGTLLGAGGVYGYSESEGLVRLAVAYGFAAVGVMSVATIAFFISSWTTSSLSAIGGAIAVMILFNIVGIIDYFRPVHPYLFTTYFDSWNLIFVDPVPRGEVTKALGVLFAYVAVFFTAGLVVFKRKDILS